MQEYLPSLQDPKLIAARERNMERLERVFQGEHTESVFLLNGVNGESDADPYLEPEQWVEEALQSLVTKADLLHDPITFRPLGLECWLYGVHFTDRIFGATVYYQTENWWSEGLQSPIGELPVGDLETNATWTVAKRLAQAMTRSGATVPFFGTQVLGAPFNQAFNLYKDRLLYGLHDNPTGVVRDLTLITETLCEMHRWYQSNLPPQQLQPVVIGGRCQPRGYGQMCGCSTQLLSPQMYQDYIVPLDEQMLSLHKHGGMYHLCGSHSQHLPAWRRMKRLRAVQLNDRAAEDLELYFNELRDDQIIYLNPTETMTIERALTITGGRRLVLVTNHGQQICCCHEH